MMVIECWWDGYFIRKCMYLQCMCLCLYLSISKVLISIHFSWTKSLREWNKISSLWWNTNNSALIIIYLFFLPLDTFYCLRPIFVLIIQLSKTQTNSVLFFFGLNHWQNCLPNLRLKPTIIHIWFAINLERASSLVLIHTKHHDIY